MGKPSRDKGARVERALVKMLQGKGFAAERVPLSGAAGGRYASDISAPVLGADWRFEVKARANGFVRLYDWLAGNDALILKADRRPPLLVIDLSRAADVAIAADKLRALAEGTGE